MINLIVRIGILVLTPMILLGCGALAAPPEAPSSEPTFQVEVIATDTPYAIATLNTLCYTDYFPFAQNVFL